MINKLLLSILIIFAMPCFGERWNFLMGSDYLNFNETEQIYYITGVNDGLNTASAECINWIRECSKNKSVEQMLAIFNKWLKSRPEYLHWPASDLYVYALDENCQQILTLPSPSEF